MGARFDTLKTERLLMRRWQDSDREPYAAMNADPAVIRFFPGPMEPAASYAHIEKMERLFEEQGFGLWALEVAESGEFIGFTGLNPMPEGVPGSYRIFANMISLGKNPELRKSNQ